MRSWAATFGLLSCAFFAASVTASAQFQIVGPAPVSASVAHERIRTLLEKVDPANRQQTIKDIFGLVNWYRDLLDEELIAAWQRDGRANLTEVMEPLADSRVAVGVIEFSWRQQRQATFTPVYAPMLGHLMARYPESAKPFFDDLLGSTAPGGQALDLSQPETEAVCRILLDLPDIRDFRKSALRILPHYRRDAVNLLDNDRNGDDREKRDRAPRWLADLAAIDSAFAVQSSAVPATPPRPTAMAPAASNAPVGQSMPNAQGPSSAAHAGVILPPLNPATVDDKLVSTSGAPALIDFVNRSNGSVDIYWIDAKGARVLYRANLAAGATFSERTFLTHSWLVVVSGTGGTTARDSGIRLEGFQAVTPNAGFDPANRDIAIIGPEAEANAPSPQNVPNALGAPGMNNLGSIYETGRGVPQDYGEALRWYRQAASAGGPNGFYNVGRMYELGRGVARDYRAAVEWYRKGTYLNWAPAMTGLARMYADGRGIAQDYSEALRWYRKAADARNTVAMAALGKLYETGRGVDQDLVEAVRWYRLAAEASGAAGMAGLGHMYEIGGGVQQDYIQAFQWYLKAAQSGMPAAMVSLGLMYENGHAPTQAFQPTLQDYGEALKWYEKAATAGDAAGMYRLAQSYEIGKGGPPDRPLALEWYRKAAAAGSGPARARLGNEASGTQPAAANPRPAPAGAGTMGRDGVYRAGNAVSQPVLVSKVEPQYSETGRKLIAEGTVVLQIVIQPDGTPRDFRIMRSLGYGLDEKAIEAVRQWRFNPGMKDGNGVPVLGTIEVNFSLLMKRVPDRWASGAMTFALEAGVTRPVVKDGAMPKTVQEVGDESVVLAFTVDSNGSVKNIHSTHGSQSASELLTRSLTNWKFQPAMQGSRPIEATGTVLFTKGNGDEAANRGLSPSPQAVAANGANSARPSILAEEDGNGVTHAPAPPDGMPVAPGSGDPVIQGAREAARRFVESLPNFAAKRFTNRYTAHGDRSSWQALDAVGADVIFENGKESYRNTQVSGKPPGDSTAPPGSWSTGEIASVLQSVMAPQTSAVFSNKRPVAIVNRAAFRYDFSVEQPNSHWTVTASPESYTPAYAGAIWIDQEDDRVLRIEMSARNLPGSFALAAVESQVDYDYVPIGGRKFLLPVRSEMLSCARATGDCVRNVVTFQNYEKFGADDNRGGGSGGSGPGGGIVGSVYRPGNGVSAPVVTLKVPPEYSQEAQNARRSGTVVLSVVVDPEGYARNIQVVEPLGMGLDQKAIEAVQKWRFRPGYKDGRAVNVFMQVQVGFRVQ